MAQGMGMRATRVTTVASLDAAVAEAMSNKGPALIEVML